ncbi:MAG: sensor histidine kinase [Planctomycetota bacterium]|jgi:signal transduction histidine kinase
MRASRKKSIAASVSIFALITAVVIGGMSWASYLQLDLADREAQSAHDSRVREALMRLDGYMNGLLIPELARDASDYLWCYLEDAEKAWSKTDGRRIDVKVEQVSDITKMGPRYGWIDLYFHVSEPDESGTNETNWRSPQITGQTSPSPRAIRTLEWLKSTISVEELAERVVKVRSHQHGRYAKPSMAQQGREVQPMGGVAPAIGFKTAQTGPSLGRRWDKDLQSQFYLAQPDKCFVGERVSASGRLEADLLVCNVPMTLDLTADPLAVFWLDGPPKQGPRLLFVRTGHENDARCYQGFVADWQRLKPHLLQWVTHDLFPDADLVPIAHGGGDDDSTWDPKLSMSEIPVRLAGPSIETVDTAGARSSIIRVLVLAWVVALTVLAVAALAVRNLVALTNRRLQFAYAVTHELRTPLTTFRLYADMLAQGLVPEDSKQEYLDSLNNESIRLSNIVQAVLEYSRLENQRVAIRPEDLEASALIASIEDSIQSRCDRDGVQGELATEGLPRNHKLHTDVDLVNQITGVLVDNAVRHARSSSKPSVRVSLTGQNGSVSINVSDSGAGIDRQDARQIFKPFRRGRTAETNAQRGIGLGLALARSWATLLGGRLELIHRHDPQLGGAHFCLTIPNRIAD